MNNLHNEFDLVKLKFLSYTHSEYSSDKEVMEVIWDMAEASYRERNASNDKDYTVTEPPWKSKRKPMNFGRTPLTIKHKSFVKP